MAITVISHILNHAAENVVEDLNGVRFQVGYLVSGLDIAKPKSSRLDQAINARAIPPIGLGHPSVANTFVTRREAELVLDTPTSAIVTIQYGSENVPGFGFGIIPGAVPPTIRVDSTLQTVETNFKIVDLVRVPIVLTQVFDGVVFPDTDDPNDFISPVGKVHRGGEITQADELLIAAPGTRLFNLTVKQPGKIQTQLPFTTLTLTRAEFGSPLFVSAAFTATINMFEFQGFPPHKWLCTRIGGSSNDGGNIYIVDYSFQLSPEDDGWDTTVTFVDGGTGNILLNPGPDATQDVRVIRTANWDNLLL